MRYLLYHPELGVYLGNGRWSLSSPGDRIAAPTFDKDSQILKVVGVDPPEELQLKLHEAHPDLPGFQCSMNAVADAGLPRWGEEGAPKRPKKDNKVKPKQELDTSEIPEKKKTKK